MTTMYTSDHEWINIEDHEAATVGITHHAQDALGDVVFVDLPEPWARTFKKGDVAGVVESVKAAADLYMPVSGEVVEVNENPARRPVTGQHRSARPRLVLQSAHVNNMAEFEQLMDGARLRRPAEDALISFCRTL